MEKEAIWVVVMMGMVRMGQKLVVALIAVRAVERPMVLVVVSIVDRRLTELKFNKLIHKTLCYSIL